MAILELLSAHTRLAVVVRVPLRHTLQHAQHNRAHQAQHDLVAHQSHTHMPSGQRSAHHALHSAQQLLLIRALRKQSQRPRARARHAYLGPLLQDTRDDQRHLSLDIHLAHGLLGRLPLLLSGLVAGQRERHVEQLVVASHRSCDQEAHVDVREHDLLEGLLSAVSGQVSHIHEHHLFDHKYVFIKLMKILRIRNLNLNE